LEPNGRALRHIDGCGAELGRWVMGNARRRSRRADDAADDVGVRRQVAERVRGDPRLLDDVVVLHVIALTEYTTLSVLRYTPLTSVICPKSMPRYDCPATPASKVFHMVVVSLSNALAGSDQAVEAPLSKAVPPPSGVVQVGLAQKSISRSTIWPVLAWAIALRTRHAPARGEEPYRPLMCRLLPVTRLVTCRARSCERLSLLASLLLVLTSEHYGSSSLEFHRGLLAPPRHWNREPVGLGHRLGFSAAREAKPVVGFVFGLGILPRVV